MVFLLAAKKIYRKHTPQGWRDATLGYAVKHA